MLMSFIFFSFAQEFGFSVLGSVPLEADLRQGFDCKSLFWGSKCRK